MAAARRNRTFRLPDTTFARLEALAAHASRDDTNVTATLVRIIEDAHRAAGLPEPEVSEEPMKPDDGGGS